MNKRRGVVLLATVAVTVGILVAQFMNISAPVARSEAPDTKGKLGVELANALGLKPIYTNRVDGCGEFTEMGDFGYCLDAVVGNDNLAAQILASQLHGHEPSATELRYFELRAEFARLGEEPMTEEQQAARIQLVQEISDLQVQLTEGGGSQG
jgi:hypothetical protein